MTWDQDKREGHQEIFTEREGWDQSLSSTQAPRDLCMGCDARKGRPGSGGRENSLRGQPAVSGLPQAINGEPGNDPQGSNVNYTLERKLWHCRFLWIDPSQGWNMCCDEKYRTAR